MATIKTSDAEVQLYLSTDPYRFDVDNRPLRNLIDNDIRLNAELTALSAEIEASHWAIGRAEGYPSLDARLEDMTSANSGNSSVSYAIFQAQADKNRALYQSGWLTMPTTKSFWSGDTAAPNGFTADDFGGLFGTRWVNRSTANTMYINTEFEAASVPLTILVNGWLVKLSDMQAGGAVRSGSNLSIKLPDIGNVPSRQDFIFLEVWLKAIAAAAPVFWLYGSPQYDAATHGEGVAVLGGNCTDNPLDPRVVHTLSKLPNGDWLQVQHRIRVKDGVSPLDNADGFTGSNAALVRAQGALTAPTDSRSFTNMLADGDAGLYRAGDGASDAPLLKTYDGYTYAIPIAMVHRRANENFTLATQNGAKKTGVAVSGTLASGVSGRPDGLFYDSIERQDYIDMRHWIDSYNIEFERLLQMSFDEILRGTSRAGWKQLEYSVGVQHVWGNRLLKSDTIFSQDVYGGWLTDPSLGANTNYVKDGSRDGTPVSKPDGVRRLFAASPVPQRIEFFIDPTAGTSDALIPNFITVTASGGDRIVTVDATKLSGGTGNTVGTRNPVWFWLSTGETINPTPSGAGNTKTFTFAIGAYGAGEKVVCNVDVMFPSKSGTTDLPDRVIRQELFDGNSTHSSFATKINDMVSPLSLRKDSQGRLWVSEFNGAYSKITLWVEASDGALTKHTTDAYHITSSTVLGNPAPFGPLTGIAVVGDPLAVDGSGLSTGSVYAADHSNGRIKQFKFNGTGWTMVGNIQPFASNDPYGIDVSPDGTVLYAVSQSRHCVYKFATANLAAAPTVFVGVPNEAGNTSVAPVKLNGPVGVTVAADGTVWVTDYNNYRTLKLDATGDLIIAVINNTDSGGGNGTAPSAPVTAGGANINPAITNTSDVVVIGTPGTNTVKYLVTGGHGMNASQRERVFKLDYQYNVEAISDNLYLAGGVPADSPGLTAIQGICVDNQTTPTVVFVCVSAVVNNGAYSMHGMLPMFYSTLGQRQGYWWKDGSSQQSNEPVMRSVKYIEGGASDYLLVAIGNPGAVNTTILTVTPVDYASYYYHERIGYHSTLKARSEAFWTHFTTPRTITGMGLAFYEIVVGMDWVCKAYRWRSTGAGTWAMDAVAVITFPGQVVSAETDEAGNLYAALPGAISGASQVVYRFKRDGDNFIAPGAVGNTPGQWGTNGVLGATRTTISSPMALAVNATGTHLTVAGKTTQPWGGAGDQMQYTDGIRMVSLTLASAKWESPAETPYVVGQDTASQQIVDGGSASTYVNVAGCVLGRPLGVGVQGDTVLISNTGHTLARYVRNVSGDDTSYQYRGKFGVEGETALDHAHLSTPYNAVFSSATPQRVVIADAYNSRLLSIHEKMAGVSIASGNVETLVPLLAADRLRLWSDVTAYQGVGSTVFTPTGVEAIWAKQVITNSEFMYVTSLGRSPLRPDVHAPTAYRAIASRVPLGGNRHITQASLRVADANFDSAPIALSGVPSISSPFLKLPIITHGMTASSGFGQYSEDSLIAYVRWDQGLTETYAHRGFHSNYANAPSFYAESFPARDAGYRLVMMPYLIKRKGKVYLLVVTGIVSDSANAIGTNGSAIMHAVDLFEVPGRLLLR